MRTSGADSDVLMYLVPVLFLTLLAVFFLGGPTRTIEFVDSTVVDTLHWLKSRW